MTATLDNNASGFDWRNKAVCKSGDYDMHFADVEELLEEEGMSREDAEAFVAMAEDTAKAICAECPVVAKCREWAMCNEEAWGIWGGMTPQERHDDRARWLMEGQEAISAPVIQQELDAMHHNAGVDARYLRRIERAKVARDMLLQLPADWSTPKTRSDKQRFRDEYLEACELLLSSPAMGGREIARRLGRTNEWFNNIFRVLFRALQIP